MTDSRSRIVHMPLPVDDPRQRRPDITRAQTELRWKPTVPLEEGLLRTISYFDELLHHNKVSRSDRPTQSAVAGI